MGIGSKGYPPVHLSQCLIRVHGSCFNLGHSIKHLSWVPGGEGREEGEERKGRERVGYKEFVYT